LQLDVDEVSTCRKKSEIYTKSLLCVNDSYAGEGIYKVTALSSELSSNGKLAFVKEYIFALNSSHARYFCVCRYNERLDFTLTMQERRAFIIM